MPTGIDFSGISHFDPHSDVTSTSQRWKEWIKRFRRFIVAVDIKEPTRQRAHLLYLAGPEVEAIFETLPGTGEDKEFDLAVNNLTAFFAQEECNVRNTRVWTDQTTR